MSVQAVNDTNSHANRNNMQKEMYALSKEINRITSVTTLAGQNIISATTTTFSFQVGTATGGPNQILTTISSMSLEALLTGRGPGDFVINGVSAGHSAGDVNGDGLADLIVDVMNDVPNGGSSNASTVVFGKADDKAV